MPADATPRTAPRPARRPWLRRTRNALLLVLAGLAAWYGGVVYSARNYTRDMVLPKVREHRFALAPTDLTPRQREILLQVEDPGFATHHGLDLWTPGAGLFTITQSLVQQLYFDGFRPGLDGRIRQTLIAWLVLDPLMPKDEQLRLFINTVRLGRGASGFEDAAHVHFGKSFAELGEDEFIALVAMVVAPEVFDPKTHPDWSAERVERVQRLVAGQYRPRSVLDVYYGPVDAQAQPLLPPLTYFPSTYE